MGRDCSIWFSTVLRGDVNSIRIGNGVNIRDGSVLHTLYEKSTIEIGDHVSVGHNVTIHGAAIRDYALIGMGSTILDLSLIHIFGNFLTVRLSRTTLYLSYFK